MTKTKTILGISLAAIFAVTMIASQTVIASGHFLDVEKSEIEMNSATITQAKLKTSGEIPEPVDGASSFFGYGVLTAKSPTNDSPVLAVATTHTGFCDSTEQVPALVGTFDPACSGIWHTHAVELTSDTECTTPFAVKRISFQPNGDVDVDDNTVEISDISRATGLMLDNVLGIPGEDFTLGQPNGQIVSFKISAIFAPAFEVCIEPIDVLEPYKFESEDGK